MFERYKTPIPTPGGPPTTFFIHTEARQDLLIQNEGEFYEITVHHWLIQSSNHLLSLLVTGWDYTFQAFSHMIYSPIKIFHMTSRNLSISGK